MKIPARVQEALDATSLPYQLDRGGQHIKIRLAGMLVGILPANGKPGHSRAEKNTISQIRRAAEAAR